MNHVSLKDNKRELEIHTVVPFLYEHMRTYDRLNWPSSFRRCTALDVAFELKQIITISIIITTSTTSLRYNINGKSAISLRPGDGDVVCYCDATCCCATCCCDDTRCGHAGCRLIAVVVIRAVVLKHHNSNSIGLAAISMPLFAALLGVSSLVAVSIVAYCTYRCCRVKKSHQKSGSPTPEKMSTPPSLCPTANPGNLKISQSTPDLMDDPGNSMTTAEEKIGRRHFKTVIKQSTLPALPQRHLTFQRQLSHKLDLSGVEFTIQSVKYKEQPENDTIKPELYRQNAQESGGQGGENLHTSGRLYFSLQYDHETETFCVYVARAEELPAKDFSGTSDPYVKVYLLPDRKNKFQTKVHRKTLNPDFDEKFYFSVPFKELPSRTLQFSVYDFDRFSRHDLIGIVMLKDLIRHCELTWDNLFVQDIISVQQEKVDLGELMFSLCYLPTAGRLTVTVIKGRNLKAMDITGTSDPYVKISLMCHGRRIKKKKTSVKKATLNPVYNEAIVFDVPRENIEEVSLIIKVIDYDRVGSNELMGCCSAGIQYLGTGRDHWMEMLENQRKPVAQWYQLQETVPGVSHEHAANGKRTIKIK
ncbi:hypothetical protein LSH36_1059g02056 [Paralvinella palmiformis]|uniref:C2 domain-containing protein n=1 Tax=Paralvinella palmiformis TaxID=53620 RepID=A0AAD9IW22_9ANNE|nr:hypothetical protein LSH36_1059g02056 [Paralvinella palmiformis]